MTFKQFILGMVSTAEANINSKIVAGFLTLFATIIFGCFKLNEGMLILAPLAASFFGLSSLDFKTKVKQDEEQI